MDIQKQVILSLENNGVYIEGEEDLESSDLLLSLNSLQFISFICDLEASIGMELPDEFLKLDNFSNLNVLIDGINLIYQGRINNHGQ